MFQEVWEHSWGQVQGENYQVSLKSRVSSLNFLCECCIQLHNMSMVKSVFKYLTMRRIYSTGRFACNLWNYK